MFDTVRLLAENIVIEEETFSTLKNLETSTYIDKETGEVTDVHKIKGSKIPLIKYNSTLHKLEIEVSIPNLLFGENLTILKVENIESFFKLLHHQLHQLLDCKLEKEKWIVKRLDVCWNFNTGTKIRDYIKCFSQMKFPYRDTIIYNHLETIEWKNGSNRTILYDKETEMRKKNVEAEIIRQAKGVLRFETRSSYNEMTSFSPGRLAKDLLTKEFFIFITERYSPHLDVQTKEEISLEWVLSQKKIADVERVLAFLYVKELAGCKHKELYHDSTYIKRKQLLKTILPEPVYLSPLKFDYEAI